MSINWMIRVCIKQGERVGTREVGPFATKRIAYTTAVTEYRKKKSHTPILRDGHTFVVYGGD